MNPPCGVCQREGGWRLKPNGPVAPPAESVAPFTGRQWFTTNEGVRLGECWPYEPMCAVHAHETIELFHRADRAPQPPHSAGPGPTQTSLDL